MEIREGDMGDRLWQFLVVALVASLFINASFIHYQPLSSWARILLPILFATGLVGSAGRLGILRIAGWAGILIFFVVSLAVSFPSEDYVLGHVEGRGPPEVGALEIGTRMIVGVGLTLLLVLTFRRAYPAHNSRT